MTFSKSFVSVLRDKGEFGLNLSSKFFRIAKHLYQRLSWGLRSKRSLLEEQTIFIILLWKSVISGKAYIFQQCETEVWLFLNIVYELAQIRTSHA